MALHETPNEVADVLAAYLPNNVKRLLDPSVGKGALLKPVINCPRRQKTQITAVDVSARCIRAAKKLTARPGIHFVRNDFLKWAKEQLTGRGRPLFDCVMMNPPFCAKSDRWCSMDLVQEVYKKQQLPSKAPIEAVFLLMALRLLSVGGRLLAIVPYSLIANRKIEWLRDLLLKFGAVVAVHELPRFTFPEIEGRIYMFVFDKGCRQGRIKLLNHDLRIPETLFLRRAELSSSRWDFSYHAAKVKLVGIQNRLRSGWWRIRELATVMRGSERTPTAEKSALHTDCYSSLFWVSRGIGCKYPRSDVSEIATKGDILVKRVSRDCSRSFGVLVSDVPVRVTDCVIIIRPRSHVSRNALLFAIRCLFACEGLDVLIQKGVGVSFVSQIDLQNLQVPYGLATRYRNKFARYSRAVSRQCHTSMLDLEQVVAARLTVP